MLDFLLCLIDFRGLCASSVDLRWSVLNSPSGQERQLEEGQERQLVKERWRWPEKGQGDRARTEDEQIHQDLFGLGDTEAEVVKVGQNQAD